jgi:hypothetical protein
MRPVPLENTIRSGDLRVLGGSGCVRVFVNQAAQDGSSVDPCGIEVSQGEAGGVMIPVGDMLCDEHQDVQSVQQRGVRMQEIDGEDPSGLGVQELPPAGARAARRRIDASSVQTLPDGALHRAGAGDQVDVGERGGCCADQRSASV